jgi:hypothetical protein
MEQRKRISDSESCEHLMSIGRNDLRKCGDRAVAQHEGLTLCEHHYHVVVTGHCDEYSHGDSEYGNWSEDEDITVDDGN